MSLGSTYVLASDGNFYSGTIWAPTKNVFICFDNDDPPELVIKLPKGVWSNVQAEMNAECILRELSINASITSKPSRSSRVFNHGAKHSKFELAISFFIAIKSPVDPSIITPDRKVLTQVELEKQRGWTLELCGGIYTPSTTNKHSKGKLNV